MHGIAGVGQTDLGGEEIDGVHQNAPLIGCTIDKPSKDATFLDINDELGLGQLAAQALVLAG